MTTTPTRYTKENYCYLLPRGKHQLISDRWNWQLATQCTTETLWKQALNKWEFWLPAPTPFKSNTTDSHSPPWLALGLSLCSCLVQTASYTHTQLFTYFVTVNINYMYLIKDMSSSLLANRPALAASCQTKEVTYFCVTDFNLLIAKYISPSSHCGRTRLTAHQVHILLP